VKQRKACRAASLISQPHFLGLHIKKNIVDTPPHASLVISTEYVTQEKSKHHKHHRHITFYTKQCCRNTTHKRRDTHITTHLDCGRHTIPDHKSCIFWCRQSSFEGLSISTWAERHHIPTNIFDENGKRKLQRILLWY
jgi:hypothetical protein